MIGTSNPMEIMIEIFILTSYLRFQTCLKMCLVYEDTNQNRIRMKMNYNITLEKKNQNIDFQI